MGTLLQALSDEDKELISDYVDSYSNNVRCSNIDLDYNLRFWDSEKADLYKMFGNQLILSKEVSFCMSQKEVRTLMDTTTAKDPFIKAFSSKIAPYYHSNYELWMALQMLTSPSTLVENESFYDTKIVPAKDTVFGKPVKIQKGCRPIKTLHKLCRAFGLNEAEFEDFRLKHSQVLNTRKLQGELCLSIHPMDFMTMSDNDCGWDSCMSWRAAYYGDGGEYRLGTIEMMNSPCVIIAYLKSHTDMKLEGRYLNSKETYWNNKRWRQLVIVNEDVILGNRQYCYEDASLSGTVLEWVRELATAHYGVQYEDTAQNLAEGSFEITGKHLAFTTNYMYNDIYGTRLGYLRKDLDYNINLNFSGVANCMACGDMIAPNEAAATDTVVCANCGGYTCCTKCGTWIVDDDEYTYYVDGDYYCQDCFHDVASFCECCEDYVRNDEYGTHPVCCDEQIIPELHICMCDSCYGDYKSDQGVEAVDIDALSTWQVDCIDGAHYQLIRQLRKSTPNSHERYKLIQEILS